MKQCKSDTIIFVYLQHLVMQPFVVAYYALAASDRLQPHDAGSHVQWFPLEALPALPGVHREVVTLAHERLATKLDYSTIAFQFMADKFTLSELQRVYEIILRERLDKRNFRKQILAMGRLEDTGEERRNGSHRPARLYRPKYPGRVEIIR